MYTESLGGREERFAIDSRKERVGWEEKKTRFASDQSIPYGVPPTLSSVTITFNDNASVQTEG